ncbi:MULTISPECIES: acyl-CoA dehydrogenase [unclassified Streptomyces]|uniref:acyl-CoA dehydrogenase n=1 Tax=unclassified Streptomyces TaxID=2593676 RepID=UPI0006FA88A6|nr:MULTISPECIES: acyl-CoA dehydrogenase [unclassified Streptomyces]KQX53173.1 acyl-CoA dehydrogenase [Streptomyces sp. Root1304]KRA90094.1 acyl-CoA dehydrogenase [Streptomyces sp. Root66D1]
MGIAITHEQRELARAVRGWLGRAVPSEEVRKHLDVPDAAVGRPGYWDGAAGQGLLGIHLPEECGGGGGDLVDLAVVVEEAARALLPGPFLPTVLAAAVLHRAGQAELAAALASGERVGAVAFGGTGTLTAVRTTSGHLLDGTAPPVLGGAQADLLILRAATADGSVWLAVDADGLTVRPHESADPTRPTAEITARAAHVPAARELTLGGAESATGHIAAVTALVQDLAAVLFAADACGTAARAVDTAAEHARTREQFGRPIGQFQGVKHLCADMLVRLEQARALTWDAARAAGPGEDEPESGPRSLTAALAAATALDTSYSCAKDCIQILGGTGFTWEHDAHLLLRRALVARQLLGTGDHHRLAGLRHAVAGVRRGLRLDLPPEADAYRTAAREAVAPAAGLDPAAARRALVPTGYAAPHLPEPYGLGAGPLQQLAVQRELDEAGIKVSGLGIATWVVPSLLAHGTPAQQEEHLAPTLRGERLWCQLFSEPGAGSDLASLRTRAERTEDGRWRINGQKVWTSAAQWAHHGILLARTDPTAPKHQGLTYFLVDMRNTPGIDIRPLKEITGDSLFNEVWFDDVLLPADAVVGEVDDGWRVARNTLGNERVHMADQVAFDTGLEALIERAAPQDSSVRVRIGALLAEAHALACIGLRTTLLQVSGLEPGAGASVRKLVQTLHQQRLAELTLELLGPEGAVREGPGERAVHGLLMSRCLTIAGGTTQVQLNVVAERLLGLPRD